ncbi:hypothetical protein SCG7086_AB_00150 [Chlamydiales bacterium SCGC AG-110-P3]|nr:hypothetical protein SCG7086_AB_00150 [Chlamydiales bacterium SCGC AG-110-P3]
MTLLREGRRIVFGATNDKSPTSSSNTTEGGGLRSAESKLSALQKGSSVFRVVCLKK